MSEYKIDEKFLKRVANAGEKLISKISSDMEGVLNKDGDIFERYMCFHRLDALFSFVDMGSKISKNSFKLGHDLQNPAFKTESAIKNGWGDVDLSKNPFFENDNETDDDDDDDDDNFNDAMHEILNKIGSIVREK